MTDLPTWEQLMVPVLQVLSDGAVWARRDIYREASATAGITDDQLRDLMKSGLPRAYSRVGWSLSYLNRVDALHRPSRGRYEITQAGRDLLAIHPDGITEKDLKAIAKPGDEWWKSKRTTSPTSGDADTYGVLDPTEQVEQGVARIHDEVASELLARLCAQDPAFFEQAVVDLLLEMGYGGVGGQGVATALSHDGGIDGIIDQDRLGLGKVYIQAKRYAPGNAVQRPEVQGFVGALSGKADGGVFITTSKFSKGAAEWVETVPARVILIDGQRLAGLMIEYGVGVQTERTYRVVKIDEDFFT